MTVMLVPVLNWAPGNEDVWASGGRAPRNPNLGIKWK